MSCLAVWSRREGILHPVYFLFAAPTCNGCVRACVSVSVSVVFPFLLFYHAKHKKIIRLSNAPGSGKCHAYSLNIQNQKIINPVEVEGATRREGASDLSTGTTSCSCRCLFR